MVLSLLPGILAWAQEEPFEAPPHVSEPERKRPGVFHRPAKDTPAEQLAYAARLHVEGKLKRAAKQYLAVVHEWHDTPEAVRAQLAYAEILLAREYIEKAFQELQYLMDHYAGQFAHDRVLKHQLAIAHLVRTKRRGKFLFYRGFTAPERALPLLARIVDNAPNWEQAPEAQYYCGKIREDLREYSLAADAYETLLNRYPQSDYALQASHHNAVCLWALSNRAPRDEQRCRAAIGTLAGFIRSHPDAEQAEDAKQKLEEMNERFAGLVYERAAFYDRSARRPKSALIAYREFVKRFTLSSRAAAARERIKALEQQQEARNAE